MIYKRYTFKYVYNMLYFWWERRETSDKWKLIICFMIPVGMTVLMFYLFGKPYKRGFFCNDESLYHPFHDSTVTSAMLYVIGLLLPICTVSHLLPSDFQKKHQTIYILSTLWFSRFAFWTVLYDMLLNKREIPSVWKILKRWIYDLKITY